MESMRVVRARVELHSASRDPNSTTWWDEMGWSRAMPDLYIASEPTSPANVMMEEGLSALMCGRPHYPGRQVPYHAPRKQLTTLRAAPLLPSRALGV